MEKKLQDTGSDVDVFYGDGVSFFAQQDRFFALCRAHGRDFFQRFLLLAVQLHGLGGDELLPGAGVPVHGLFFQGNEDGELSAKELSEQMKKWEIGDYMIEPLGEGKHIFSHVEWQMRGYRIQMRDISEKLLEKEEWIAVSREDLEEKYAIPSAFECYRKQIYQG